MLITDLALKYRSTTYLLMILILLFGSLSYASLPRESTPDVEIPVIVVSTIYAGVSPSDIESLITLPIERQLKGLKGVEQISSHSSESVSNIVIEFQTGIDLDSALQRVKDKVDISERDLPTDLEEDPIIIEISMSDFPVMLISISGDIPEFDLKEIADKLQDDIEGVPGVLEVTLSGARVREILVEFNYLRLQAYAISIDQIGNAIRSENIDIPGGTIDIGLGKYLVRVPGSYKNVKDMENIVITMRDGKPVYLKDIAAVKDSFEDKDTYARLNGSTAISIAVKKRAGENVLKMTTDVKQILADAEQDFPPALSFDIVVDTSKDILSMVSILENNILTGLILVVIVLFLFLGARNSFFIALSIPFSMLISFIVFYIMDLTLNMTVLFALIMSLGMLVDSAIVIVENIFRHMQNGQDRLKAAKSAANEVGWPLIAAMLTNIVAYVPLLFWPGISGEFMKFIPLTLIIVLTSSFFVALIFNPVICATFMKVPDTKLNDTDEESFGKFIQFYIKALNYALNNRRKLILLTIFITILPIGIYILSPLSIEFFPQSDPPISYFQLEAPQGTSAKTTSDMLEIIEAAASTEPEVKAVLSEVGGAAASYSDMGGSTTHLGRVTTQFYDFNDRKESSLIVTERIREKLQSFPGAIVTIEKPEMGPPTGAPVSIEISGEDLDTLKSISTNIQSAIIDIEGLTDLKDDLVISKPEIRINVDREKAALVGLSTQIISSSIRNSLYGLLAGKYREKDDEFDIKVKLPLSERQTIEDIENMRISTNEGRYIPISSVADISLASGFGTIARYDFKRVVNITGEATGRSSVEILKDIRTRLEDLNLPTGYTINYTGETEDQEDAMKFLSLAFIVVVFLITIVLLLEFNYIPHVLIINTTVLLSFGGVFWGLLITYTNFGLIMTGIGLISLAGVVVNNGIILIDFTNHLLTKEMNMREAVVKAAAIRFRPVMLTAITGILSLLPMSVGYGFNVKTFSIESGAEMSQFWSSMSNAVIFGLAFSTILTLVLVPVLYSFTKGGLKNDVRPDIKFKDLFQDISKDSFKNLFLDIFKTISRNLNRLGTKFKNIFKKTNKLIRRFKDKDKSR